MSTAELDADADFLALDDIKPAAAANEQEADDDDAYDSMEESPSSDDDEDDDDNDLWKPKQPRLPPWIDRGTAAAQQQQQQQRNNRSSLHPLTALHNEIVSFVHLMEPLPSEMEQRDQLVERIRQTVAVHFGQDAEVQVFGSQATGLFLPTSDIDLVVITNKENEDDDDGAGQSKETSKNNAKTKTATGQKKTEDNGGEEEYDFASQKSPLHRFADAVRLDFKDELSYLEVVEKTRIPLVKLTHAPTRISVDVSFNQPTGPPAAQLMRRYLEALPPLRPLTFVLKYFLAARELNEPYSGGVGSYMLQLMIVAFLQHRERDAKNFQRPSVYNLGSLLLEFFELYGVALNFFTTGISVRYDGFFFPKGASDRKAVFCSARGNQMMALENPLDPTQNVGQSSFRYPIVHRAFKVAYRILLAHVTAGPQEHDLRDAPSILAAILPPTDYMTSRLVLKRRDRPLAAARGGGGASRSGYKRSTSSGDAPQQGGEDRKRARR